MNSYYYYCPVCGELSELDVHEKVNPQLIALKCWYCDHDLIPYTETTGDILYKIVDAQVDADIKANPELQQKINNREIIKVVYWEEKNEEYLTKLFGIFNNPLFDRTLYQKQKDLRAGKAGCGQEVYDEINKKCAIEYEKVEAINESIERQLSASSQPTPTPQQESNQKICPKCGGTSFTPVRKNWSFLTGILTNKVELVCNQCGQKIKA